RIDKGAGSTRAGGRDIPSSRLRKRAMQVRSFRLRLTLWHLAFFSLLFIVSGVLLYGVLSRALVRQLDDTISAEAATTANLFADEMHEMQGDAVHAAPEALSGLRLRAGAAAIFEGGRMLASAPP